MVDGFILVALNEYFTLAEKKGVCVQRLLGLLFAALLPFSTYLSASSFILVLACLCFFIFNFRPKLREQALLSIAVSFFGLIYIGWFFSHLVKIRYLPHGAFWVFYAIRLVKGGDAGAYFVGKKYGRTKLIEHVSPNKSVEGALGGLAVTFFLSLISKTYLPHVSLTQLALLGVVIGVLSQFGDLAESLLKRGSGIKDSGEIPGLGGILDVLDSLLLTVPFVYYFLLLARIG